MIGSESSISPVFIVGVPRSGTTLLANLMGGHPLLAPIYETGFLRNLLVLCEKACWFWGDSLSRRLCSYLWENRTRSRFSKECEKFRKKVLLFTDFGAGDWHGMRQTYEAFPFDHVSILFNFDDLVRETDAWLRHVQAGPLPSEAIYGLAREYVDRLFSFHCARMNKPYWLNKTPGLLSHLNRLPRLYPKAKCIHILRDGRDVAVSILSLSWGPNNLHDAARWWKRRVLAGRNRVNAKELAYMELRYEELIRSPREILETAFSFMGLSADLNKVLSHVAIYEGRVGSWRSFLSQRDRKIFAKEAGDLLIELGYEKDYSWVG